MKYIITADDFGISPLIDLAIEQAIDAGIVTAVACFPNGKENGQFSMHRVQELRYKYPDISIGMHFTITSGTALTGNSSLTRKFPASDYFRSRYSQHPTKINQNDLKNELEAQIAAFDDIGLQIDFFSDHNGFSCFSPEMIQIFTEVVVAYQQSKGKKIPMRNPILTAYKVNNIDNCLDQSKMYTWGKIGINVKNFFRKELFDGYDEIGRIRFKKGIKDMLDAFNSKGISTTDFFIEHLFNQPHVSVVNCIFSDSLKDEISDAFHKIDSTDRTSEVVAHLGLNPEKLYTVIIDVKSELNKIRFEYQGIAMEQVRYKRHRELEVLTAYFQTNPGVVLTNWKIL